MQHDDMTTMQERQKELGCYSWDVTLIDWINRSIHQNHFLSDWNDEMIQKPSFKREKGKPVLLPIIVPQALVAYINIGCYYFIGVPLGVFLGFKFDYGIKGLWGGMIGGTIIQISILLWITFRTDWNKEVEEAKRRVDKWNDTEQPLLANVQ